MSHKRLQTDYSIIHDETTSHMFCICLHDKYGNVSCININKSKCTKVRYPEMWWEKCLCVYVSVTCIYICMCVCEGAYGGARMGGRGRARLGNRGGVGVVTTEYVRTVEGSLRLEQGVMTSSCSVLPEASVCWRIAILNLAPRTGRHCNPTLFFPLCHTVVYAS